MFIIRESRPEDVSTLLKLARMVYFINLPPDERLIAAKIEHSQRCFKRAAARLAGHADAPNPKPPSKRKRHDGSGWADAEHESDLFMFSIEDTETRSVVGTSQVRAHQGGPGNPNWTFRITEKSFRSETLGWGTTHKGGQLHGDESGPSEIGGLIIMPSYRGHRARPGRLLSFVRFHFIALHRALFADRIIAEMMPPVSSDGDNPFWDHFGRKFIPVKYSEADRFCQHNRNFISELFPKDEIYLSLFPLEVQNVVGAVSRETIPAKRMLEALGFKNRGFVDPFDGGPHLDATTDEVTLVRETRPVTLKPAASPPHAGAAFREPIIASTLSADGEFRAVEAFAEGLGATISLAPEAHAALATRKLVLAGMTPMHAWIEVPDATPQATTNAAPDAPTSGGVAPSKKSRGARGSRATKPRKVRA